MLSLPISQRVLLGGVFRCGADGMTRFVEVGCRHL